MTETNKNTLSSESTKEKLINEGIKQFALHGINGVRTRQLAENYPKRVIFSYLMIRWQR